MCTDKSLIPVVLVGGYGSRLGYTEKGLLNINGIHQYQFLSDLLLTFFDKVFISLRSEQIPFYSRTENMEFVTDKFENKGPMGGIVSCLEYSGKSILVIACDMPNITKKAITELIANRDLSKFGTAFKTGQSGRIQPLFAIYEYRSLGYFNHLLANSNYSLSQNMNNNDFSFLTSDNVSLFRNINSVGD
ncbi:MAG: molybdenum cofactor guanylyltransferase [Saprospiraceae bacterium]|nr:molybdenum cofactor guanylyltransferase [Saprospiraceae bacterium]